MFLQGVVIFCLAIVQCSLCYDEMDGSKDPILQYLQLDPESAPQHELVEIEFPKQLHKRAFVRQTLPAGTKLRIRTLDGDVNLWLHPRNPTRLFTDETPVYFIKHAPGKTRDVEITQQHGLMKMIGKIFEDPQHLASMVLGTDNYGRRTVNGIIGAKKLAIRSLPESVVKEYVRKRRSIDARDDDLMNSTYHVLYRIGDDLQQDPSLNAFNVTMLRERATRSANGIPYTIYPRILAIADYSMYKAQGSYIYDLLEYLMAYWNGIDLKYRVLEKPKVVFYISGILIAVDARGLPYIYNNMVSADAFDANQAMHDSTLFFNDIKDSMPLTTYDIPFTTTRLAFGLGGESRAVGKGYLKTACKRSSIQVFSVTMGRDDGLFSGVFSGAHEIGHTLGTDHDELQSDDCSYKNGFIMATFIKFTENSTLFSTCSLNALQTELDKGNLKCLYQRPRMNGKKLATLMPGRIVSMQERCSNEGYQLPCNISHSCSNLHCLRNDGYCEKINADALDGTQCNEENERIARFCINGRCVRV